MSLDFISVKRDVLQLLNLKTFCFLISSQFSTIFTLNVVHIALSHILYIISSIIYSYQYLNVLNILDWDISCYFWYLVIVYALVYRFQSFQKFLLFYLSVYLFVRIPISIPLDTLYPNQSLSLFHRPFLNFYGNRCVHEKHRMPFNCRV